MDRHQKPSHSVSSAADAAAIKEEVQKLWGTESDWLPKLNESNHGGEDDKDLVPPSQQHTLVLIDCGPSMMNPHPTSTTTTTTTTATSSVCWSRCCFDKALDGCEKIVRERVRNVATKKSGSAKDSFGILLYNTRMRTPPQPTPPPPTTARIQNTSSDGNHDDDGAKADIDDDEEDDENMLPYPIKETTYHEFISLEPPGVETIKTIQRALRGCRDKYGDNDKTGELVDEIDLKGLYRHDDENAPKYYNSSPLHDAIFHAVSQLRTIRGKGGKKYRRMDGGAQIWIFTNNPYPCNRDQPKQEEVLRNSVHDYMKQGIAIVVWLMLDDDDDDVPVDENEVSMIQRYESLGVTVEVAPASMDLNDVVRGKSTLERKMRRKWHLPLIRPDWNDILLQNDHDSMDDAEKKGGGRKPASLPSGIMLDWFELVSPASLPSEIMLHATTGLPLSRETHTLPSGGGPILSIKIPPNKIVYSLPDVRWESYAHLTKDVKVNMAMEDRMRIQQAASACPFHASLILLGFKPADQVPFYHNVAKQRYFVWPSISSNNNSSEDDRNHHSASSSAFAQLRACMIRKNVVAIGEFLPTPKSASRLVALFPVVPLDDDEDGEHVDEDEDEDAHVTLQPPPGMIANVLPFADEIRATAIDDGDDDDPTCSTQDDEKVRRVGTLVSDELRDATVKLVKKLTYVKEQTPVIGMDFTNAPLEKLYQYIERVALCEPATEDVRVYDTVFSKDEQEARRIGGYKKLVDAIKVALPKKEPTGRKATARAAATGRSKRTRVAELSEAQPGTVEVADTAKVDWNALYLEHQGDLSKVGQRKLTVSDLKQYCREKGMTLTGKKADLLRRVQSHIETTMLVEKRMKAA